VPKKQTKPERTRSPQRRVHCTECEWTGKRNAELVESGEPLTECPICGSPVEAGTGQSGRPPLDPSLKRIEQHCSVLPATMLELEREAAENSTSGLPSEVAARVLDNWAARVKRAAVSSKK
jgi:hypothetical protein